MSATTDDTARVVQQFIKEHGGHVDRSTLMTELTTTESITEPDIDAVLDRWQEMGLVEIDDTAGGLEVRLK